MIRKRGGDMAARRMTAKAKKKTVKKGLPQSGPTCEPKAKKPKKKK
jgi:hypothetical protein